MTNEEIWMHYYAAACVAPDYGGPSALDSADVMLAVHLKRWPRDEKDEYRRGVDEALRTFVSAVAHEGIPPDVPSNLIEQIVVNLCGVLGVAPPVFPQGAIGVTSCASCECGHDVLAHDSKGCAVPGCPCKRAP